jgi:drug/metabolite transporter (DMT)-like permease
MLHAGELLLFALATVVMVFTPGPNMIYCVSRTLCQGRAAGMVSLAGVQMGLVLHICAAGAGLTALLLAMCSAALGYIGGARLTPSLGAEQVICWVLVLSLPLTVPVTLWVAPADMSLVRTSSWWAFAYVAVFSMWIGFFAWYKGLALGGAVRVSQVQLVQPFLSLLFAMPLLGEKLDAITLGFGVAVIATVFIGKKMPVGNAQGAAK